MSNQLPAFDDSMFQWETRTSRNGASFRIGRPKEKTAAATGVEGKKENFGIHADWPVEGQWHNTTTDIQTIAAISSYKLATGGGPFHDYTLWFDCSEHYDYFFFDETGDHYEVDVFVNGVHSVQFSSNKPKINYIVGKA